MSGTPDNESIEIPQVIFFRSYLHPLMIQHAGKNQLGLDDLIGIAVSEYLERNGVVLPRPAKDYLEHK